MVLDPGAYVTASIVSALGANAITALGNSKEVPRLDNNTENTKHLIYLQRERHQQLAQNAIVKSDLSSKNPNIINTASQQVAEQQTPMNSIAKFHRNESFRESQRKKGNSLARFKG